MKPAALFVLPLLFALAQAQAAPKASPFQCKRDGNQQELNACAASDYKEADAQLKAKYLQVMQGLPRAEQAVLGRQQRSWQRTVSPQCRAKTKPSEGGSIWPLEFAGCLKDVTEQRMKVLDRWQARGGDPTVWPDPQEPVQR